MRIFAILFALALAAPAFADDEAEVCWEVPRDTGCNVYGCWSDGGGCNVYGCWNGPRGSCNVYGCTDAGECTVYGCPPPRRIRPQMVCGSEAQMPSDESGCNVYGCWSNGGGCNVYGCWSSPYGACNVYGCSELGECNVYGCPPPRKHIHRRRNTR
ncbi:MAG TPA: hypothetical protein VL463_28565 [Kofleriaceae bacterium]|jgi:hypothetical protein|nr:hypothetical protein [Kofleriaceae bacterium]